MKRTVVMVLLAIGTVVAVSWLGLRHRGAANDERLVLHGNIDLRQVLLAFNNSERIADVLVQEGDRVKLGQVVARLDKSRLEPQVSQAKAQVVAQRQVYERLRRGSRPEEIAQARASVEAQQQVVDRLHHGSRPEEIAQARADVESAQAEVAKWQQEYRREEPLMGRGAVTREEFESTTASLATAQANLAVRQNELELALIGPRKEDIAQAEAQLEFAKQTLALAIAGPRKEEIAEAEARLHAAEAEVALLQQKLRDADLVAPVDAIVRTRVMEPGEMASPQKPVLSLAVTDPKWVRAYVSEPQLGKVHPGMRATITVDSFPDRPFQGWVGFVSPVAEFTPKNVETEELRPSLVYEVRVFTEDPDDNLRLGMPATVALALEDSEEESAAARTTEPSP
jgi:HlyD family secretion protein